MREEVAEALMHKFPLLYRHLSYFECGTGWATLLTQLSAKLEPLISAMPDEERPFALQVKEKFGALRFYMSSATDEMLAYIQEAESTSARTCEECGQPGKTRPGGWLRTICDAHAGGGT